MIDKNVVKQLVNEWLEDKDYFLVDVNVTPDDKITVEIDHADGVWIEDCAQLSQYIEDHLSRDDEDYELEVGSAGLGQPFKVEQQYHNFVGEPWKCSRLTDKRCAASSRVSTDETLWSLSTKR